MPEPDDARSENANPSLKDLLLAPKPRTDTLTPPRREFRLRRVPRFE